MTDFDNQVNNTVAELHNVQLTVELLTRASERPDHLPGIVTLTGFSGYGKTYAASFVANMFNASYIACQSTMTKKSFLEAIAREVGISPMRKSAGVLMEEICSEIITNDTPLIIDEADYLIQKNLIEIVRDIYEGTQAPILLIGEENFPSHLAKFERFHNRILQWGLAQPCSLSDARQLAKLYHPNMDIKDCLLEHLVKKTQGVTRRIVVNLDSIHQTMLTEGLTDLTVQGWGTRKFWNGEPPKRRVVR